jgi:2-phospho-L-lactate transferase/gluconeogenesis factor (CofD/UPF0052 family)
MKQPPIKQDWVAKCIDIHNFHVSQVKSESNWTVDKTAKALQRSVGSVCQDLLLASWLRTHEKQLKRFRNAKDALEFIRAKKREMKSQELEL